MTSKREQVAEAILAMAAAALPYASVKRNQPKPQSIGPGGNIILRDGDPGDPEIDLSPLRYTYEHRFVLELAGYASDTLTREQVLDSLLIPLGEAAEADRSLGGLTEWLEFEAPNPDDDLEAFGADPAGWAEVALIATYVTSNPLR